MTFLAAMPRNSSTSVSTPVISGVGQVANKDDERIVHPVDLLEAAALLALADAGIPVDRIGGVLATPLSTYSEADPSQLLAARLGLQPGMRIVSTYSGAAPQRLIAQACKAITDGVVEAVLVVGGIADASVRRARRQGVEPPAPPTSRWSQGTGAPVFKGVERGRGGGYYAHVPEIAAGAGLPSSYFALVESALMQGQEPAAQRNALGRLLAPFTEVAATRPELAWFPGLRSAADIATPTAANRLIAEPYTKLMCSFPTVDLAAAVVVSGSIRGDGTEVRPLTIVSGAEARPPSGRPDVRRSQMLERIVESVQELSGIDLADVALFDLYSCFPAAVHVLSAALGLGPDDPRPRTATGGLPYFGGPGASYSLHGIVSLVEELRAKPGTVAAVGSLGGMMTDFAVGLFGAVDGTLQQLDLGKDTPDEVATVTQASGVAVVDAATVLHDRENGPTEAPIIARLPDGSRVGAVPGDPELPKALSDQVSLVGREVALSTSADGSVTYLPL
jgi:acetyl-CoA C-acetyltransferase